MAFGAFLSAYVIPFIIKYMYIFNNKQRILRMLQLLICVFIAFLIADIAAARCFALQNKRQECCMGLSFMLCQNKRKFLLLKTEKAKPKNYQRQHFLDVDADFLYG